ncbi:MAG: prolipoprotein diacylglyceryl transferase [Chloroflexota bacterium]
MSNGFDLPLTYLTLVGFPVLLVMLALMLRQWVEERGGGQASKRKAKRDAFQNVFWILPAVVIGILAWFLLQPLVAGREIRIYYYGILITLGVIAAAFLGTVEARRRGFNPDYLWDALFWVVLAGIVGARLWHIFTPPPSMVEMGITTQYYLTHPLEALNIRSGGLGIPGAVIGGAIALWIYCRRKKISFLTWADVIAPGLALAQAIGRWGNFFNQEVYGQPTDLPWKIYIDPLHRVSGYENYEYFHPLFLYESLWNLLNMAILLIVGRRFEKWLKPGDIFYFYMISYAIGRFSLEFLRLDSAQVGGINFNQYFVLVVGLVAGGLIYWNHRPRRVEK